MTQGPGTYLNLAANGNILPMSFVKLDINTADSCLQCVNGAAPIGISGTWTRYAGGTPSDDNLEAVSGEFPHIASVGCVVPLQCGNTSWGVGDLLKADNLGYGTPITGNTDYSGAAAIALEPATVGVQARVLVIVPHVIKTA